MPHSLTKAHYDTAKKRANERLTGWITNVNREKDFGIPRLQREFAHAFKKIEWIPKAKQKEETEKDVIPDVDLDLKESRSEKDMYRSVGTGTSVLPLEDHQIHDSNSSNLSSSMGQAKEEIKYSDRKTPYTKTPLLLVDDADTFNQEENEPKQEALPKRNRAMSLATDHLQMRRQSILPVPGGVPFQKRRRVKSRRNARVLGVGQPPDRFEEGPELEEEEEVAPLPTGMTSEANDSQMLRQKSSSTLSLKGSTHRSHQPSQSQTHKTGGYFKLITKVGALENVMFKRRFCRNKTLMSRHELPMVKMTTEEKHQEVLANFRRLVRLLIHIRVLLNVSRIRIQEEEKSKEFKRFDDGKELSFDPTTFKTAVSYGGLTARARKVLKKNPQDRTEDDARVLMEVMLRLPVFNKYPKSVKQGLAKKMWYDMFQDGRVIVKQGDPGSRMYFVVSGDVDLLRTDQINTGEIISYHIQTMSAGSTFGELALIRNMRREFTAVCKGTSEFLSLSKDEFNQALRSRWEKDCNLRFNFLRNCDHFKDWTDKQLQVAADSSELKEYTDNAVIIGDTDGPTDRVFFVRRGQCEIVRRILVVRHQSPYLRPNILLPNIAKQRTHFMDKPYCRNRRINREETRFLTVTTLLPGNYFGAGENLRDTFILSRGKTNCVVINSAQFSIMGKSEQLRTLQRDRENSIPSNKTLYERFQRNRKWHEYRNKLIQDILAQRQVVHTGYMKDVPRSVLNQPTIPKDLVNF